MQVRGTTRNFSCSLTSSADKETFWKIWTDVENWPNFDTPLKKASIEGNMQVGAKGSITTQQGQHSSFVITEYEALKGYTFVTQLPACRLTVKRYFEEGCSLKFTHHISFTGPLAFLFAVILGRGFMKALPPVMQNLKRIAESSS